MSEQALRISRRTFLGGVAAFGIISLATNPLVAFAAPTAAEKQAEAEAALASLNAMQKNLEDSYKNYNAALEEQFEAEAKVTEAQTRIDDTNAKITKLQGDLGTRASSMYRSGSLSFLDILFGSASFQEFSTNWDILNKMNEKDASMVQQSKELRAEVETQKKELSKQQALATEKTKEAERILNEGKATTEAMQSVYDGLSAEASALLEQERAAREAEEQARAQAVIDEANKNASNNQDYGSAPSYEPVTGNAIVDRAYGCIGLPYDFGAVGPGSFDCSGLVGYALTGSFSRLGSTYTFMAWPRVSDPQPGDVATNYDHCGIYIGGGQMIHASTYGVGVVKGPVQGGMIFVRPPW